MEAVFEKALFWVITTLIASIVGLAWYLYKKENYEQDRRLCSLEGKLDDLGPRIFALEKEQEHMNPILKELGQGISRLNNALSSFGGKQDSMVDTLDEMKKDIKEQTGRFTGIAERLARLEGR